MKRANVKKIISLLCIIVLIFCSLPLLASTSEVTEKINGDSLEALKSRNINSVDITQENFLEIIKNGINNTYNLTENIILNEGNLPLDNYGAVMPLFWNVSEPTYVFTNEFTIELNSEDSNLNFYLSGPLHFVSEKTMFTMNGSHLFAFSDVTFTVATDNSTAFFAKDNGNLRFNDCLLNIPTNNSVGILIEDGADIFPNNLEVNVTGKSSTGIKCNSSVTCFDDEGITGLVSGENSIVLEVLEDVEYVNLRVDINVFASAVGVKAHRNSNVSLSGKIHTFSDSIGIFLDEKASISKRDGVYGKWLDWDNDSLELEIESNATGVIAKNDIIISFANIIIKDNAIAISTQGDLTLNVCTIEGYNAGSLEIAGDLILNSTEIQNPPSNAKITTLKKAPYLHLAPWEYYYLGDFLFFTGYSLDWYGFFLNEGEPLLEEDMPESLGIILYSDEDTLDSPLYIKFSSDIEWDINNVNTEKSDKYEVSYKLSLPKGISFPDIEQGNIDFTIYDNDELFLAYAHNIYSYVRMYFTPSVYDVDNTEYRVYISDDDGENWIDVSEDKNVIIADNILQFTNSMFENKEYLAKIEFLDGDLIGESKPIAFNPFMIDLYNEAGGDRDGGDQGEQGELPEVEITPKPQPTANPEVSPEVSLKPSSKPSPKPSASPASTTSPTPSSAPAPVPTATSSPINIAGNNEKKNSIKKVDDSASENVKKDSLADSANKKINQSILPINNAKAFCAAYTGEQVANLAHVNPQKVMIEEEEMKIFLPTKALLELKMEDNDVFGIIMESFDEGFFVELYLNERVIDNLFEYEYSLHYPKEIESTFEVYSCALEDDENLIYANGYEENCLTFHLNKLGKYILYQEDMVNGEDIVEEKTNAKNEGVGTTKTKNTQKSFILPTAIVICVIIASLIIVFISFKKRKKSKK